MAGGKVDPRRRCLKLAEWPESDRHLWVAGTTRGPRSYKGASYASHLSQKSIDKAHDGYGRYLGFLAWRGELDHDAHPAERVTRERVEAFVALMRALRNADYTIIGRIDELLSAMRILVPEREFGWLTNPDGQSLRSSFAMERREIRVYHSAELYAWGLALIETAAEAGTPAKRAMQVRDGVMIAILASRAPRLRSITAMRIGVHLILSDDRYRAVFEWGDMKNRAPIDYLLPRSLTPHLSRYLAIERHELLGSQSHDALWVGQDGAPMRNTAIKTMIRARSAKRFEEAFGIHRFRHCLGTTAALVDPTHPGIAPAVLNITAAKWEKHYNLADQVIAAGALQDAVAKARAEIGWQAPSPPVPHP